MKTRGFARRRRKFQQIQNSLIRGTTQQFEVWFQDTVLLETAIKDKTEEIRYCIEDINQDRKRYTEIIERVSTINVADFSPEELQKRTGAASRLLNMAREISVIQMHLPWKVEKLAFML